MTEMRMTELTDRAQRVLSLAWAEAARFNHGSIGTERLPLAIVDRRETCGGIAAAALTSLHVDLAGVQAKVAQLEVPPGRSGRLRSFIQAARTAVSFAQLEVDRRGDVRTDAGHQLLGLYGPG
jgi:ATP-dependent Clp protease ATP-binding subunit ClpC